jgi:hypothetical protein
MDRDLLGIGDSTVWSAGLNATLAARLTGIRATGSPPATE